ncbi:MAG: ATP-binding protein [Pseudomonadota bacterium]
MKDFFQGATPIRAHIIDDDAGDRKLLRRALHAGVTNAQVSESESVVDALSRRDGRMMDIVLLDYLLGDHDGLSGLRAIKEAWPSTAIVMVTGSGDERLATTALHSGAADYIPKSVICKDSMKNIVANALSMTMMQKKIAEQQENLKTFSHMLAHDFASPIATMEALASEALNDFEAKEVVRSYLTEIVNCAQTSQELIRSLSEHIRLDGTFSQEPCSLGHVLNAVLTNLRTEIAASGALVHGHGLPVVIGNQAELTLLLQNLVANAIKYNRSSVPMISVTAEPETRGAASDQVTICVSDNGIGIDRDCAEQIFEPFKRLHCDSEFAGTGLGLATCWKIAQRHGGKIWCEPGQDVGTAFRFTLRGQPAESGRSPVFQQ